MSLPWGVITWHRRGDDKGVVAYISWDIFIRHLFHANIHARSPHR